MIDGNHTTQELADQSDSSQPQCALFPRDPQFSPVRWLSDIPHVLNEHQGPDGLARSDAPKNLTKNGGFLSSYWENPEDIAFSLGFLFPNSIGHSPEDLNSSPSGQEQMVRRANTTNCAPGRWCCNPLDSGILDLKCHRSNSRHRQHRLFSGGGSWCFF